jgi:uncharacterized membrane protein
VTAIRRAIDAYLKGLKYIMAKPSWKNRRRYIFASFAIGAFMLVSGSIAALTGNMADISDLVTGGVALISLILTSYIFGAVWEDKTLHNKEENPDG